MLFCHNTLLAWGHPEYFHFKPDGDFIGDNDGTKGGPGPKVVPGPNGLGPKDKTLVNINDKGEPLINLPQVNIHDKLTPGMFYHNASGGGPNPFEFSNKELNDYAWQELWIAGSEVGGEFMGLR